MKVSKLFIKTICVGPLGTNCYLVADKETGQAIIIDPGSDADVIKKQVLNLKLSVIAIVNTHGHIDHIGANPEFDYPVWIHKDDAQCLTDSDSNLSYSFLGSFFRSRKPSKILEDEDIISVGSINLKCIHTPGHTPGSMCLYTEGSLFSGDTLFNGGVGRTDLLGGSQKQLEISIRKKLFILPGQTIVWPGHGEPTTIADEME